MEIVALVFALSFAVGLLVKAALVLNDPGADQSERVEYTQVRAAAAGVTEASSVVCKVQGSPRLPVFSKDGDYVIGGLFSIHYNMEAVKHNYTALPESLKCMGRLVRLEDRGCGNVCVGTERFNLIFMESIQYV